jgi:hypothetical protein
MDLTPRSDAIGVLVDKIPSVYGDRDPLFTNDGYLLLARVDRSASVRIHRYDAVTGASLSTEPSAPRWPGAICRSHLRELRGLCGDLMSHSLDVTAASLG